MLAQTACELTTLYTFNGGNAGAEPQARLLQDSAGNLYGTTNGGGTGDSGTVFMLTPAGALTTLYNFVAGNDGADPTGGLIQGSSSEFYGTTYGNIDLGGFDPDFNTTPSFGSVYEITPAGVITALHSFTYSGDGGNPSAGLVQGSDGNFYGTTAGLGPNGSGTIFQITPAGVLTTLYTFTGGNDGGFPYASLIQGSDGNFYSITGFGGASGFGTVFEVTPAGVLTTLHSFSGGSDGAYPHAGLVQGSDGNFYGATVYSGTSGDKSDSSGTIFQITPAGVLTTLHTFTGGSDGGTPSTSLIQGSDGNFYGTTSAGGAGGYGTIFQITPAGVLTTLYTFTGGNDGGNPAASLIQGSDGSFYGTTEGGNDSNYGTVFKLTVAAAPSSFFTGELPLGDGVYYLSFPAGSYFGYYAFLSDPAYLYHFDLGYEYVFDANDGRSGVYLYDFASSDFFYTSPSFPFPYLFDFGLNSVVYYLPDPNNGGHYTTNPRSFYDFATEQIITK